MARKLPPDKRWRQRIDSLSQWLFSSLLPAAPLPYTKLSDVLQPGVYVVYQKKVAVYVGKTTRTGKRRLLEMVSDRRSHTLNNKLFKAILSKLLGRRITSLGKKTEQELIGNGEVTAKKMDSIQHQVNHHIRKSFRFVFLGVRPNLLTQYEHFAIAVLNPKYND